ncbi:AraC-like DNA-binding protein [Caldicoprobacter guelmensis]|uniref:helix-turn-helix domain-containing protein n=1 Tax=Caldicoprobacter guelmensis TaxID=1170224 RepID=UPI00195829AE|nr:helix-turn-helix domain-containing protein [Caldicoprobacter guelmensis]MBM7582056.1 AraC-like DNA-binding protein [Caldicoprobacter guelmensis]
MKDQSFFIKLFISFTLLLVIITVIYILIYEQVVINSSKEEIGRNYIGKLKVAEKIMTEFKNAVRKDIVRLAASNSVSALVELKNLKKGNRLAFDNQSLIKLSNAQKSILEVVNANIRYESIYLYIEDLGFCLTSNQGLIFNDDIMDTGWFKAYIDYKNNRKPLGWIDTRLPERDDSSIYPAYSYVATYVFPLTPYTSVLQGALVLNIKEDALSQLINTDDINKEGYIFIIDSNGDVVTHVDKNYVGYNISSIGYIDKILKSDAIDGYFINEMEQKNILISYYKSINDNWIYIGVFSLEPLLSKINNLRTRVIYSSVLIALLSILSVYLISRKLSSPITKLIQDIKLNKGINIYESKDEMTILRRAFESLSNQLAQNKMNIKQVYLNNLLNANYSYGNVENDGLIEEYFKYGHFICVSVMIDKYYEFANKYEVERQYYLKMLIINIVKQIIGMDYLCEGVNLDGGEIAFIINISDDHVYKIYEDLRRYFHEIQNEIGKILDFTVSVGIGRCYEGISKIHVSYMEAKQALKWRLVLGYGSIVLWNEEFGNYSYYYPYTIEKSILNQLESRDIDRIERTVAELMSELKEKQDISCDNILLVINQLVGNTIVKYLTELKLDMNDVFGHDFNIYSELSRKETLDEIEAWLVKMYRAIIDFLIAYEEEEDETVRKIVDFIERNYKKDIGIQEVASFVGLSYSHVRKVFKSRIGENIVEFINKLRIEEAKKLLLNTELPVREIALIVGYNSDQTFARIFKKVEGVTPGEYRRFKNSMDV